jgi:hypothetical protein
MSLSKIPFKPRLEGKDKIKGNPKKKKENLFPLSFLKYIFPAKEKSTKF